MIWSLTCILCIGVERDLRDWKMAGGIGKADTFASTDYEESLPDV